MASTEALHSGTHLIFNLSESLSNRVKHAIFISLKQLFYIDFRSTFIQYSTAHTCNQSSTFTVYHEMPKTLKVPEKICVINQA